MSIRETGTIAGALYNVLNLLASMLKSDVQDVERTNALIKTEVKRSPHIGLPLLSGRVQLKKVLGSQKVRQGKPGKWSSMQSKFWSLMNDIKVGLPDAHRVQGEQRFSPVSTEPLKTARARLPHVEASDLPESVVCAARWSVQLHKQVGSTISSCICIGEAPHAVWLRVASHYSVGIMVQCQVNECEGATPRNVSIRIPLVVKDSTEIFQAEADKLIDSEEEGLMLNIHAIAWDREGTEWRGEVGALQEEVELLVRAKTGGGGSATCATSDDSDTDSSNPDSDSTDRVDVALPGDEERLARRFLEESERAGDIYDAGLTEEEQSCFRTLANKHSETPSAFFCEGMFQRCFPMRLMYCVASYCVNHVCPHCWLAS